MALMALMFGGVMSAYVQTANMSEWSGYSLAAESIAAQQVEVVRAAKWDLQAWPPVDLTTNVPTTLVLPMDLPVRGSNITYVTIFLTVNTLTVSASPPVYVKMITANAVWSYRQRRLYTNTLVTYYAADQ